MNDDEFMGEGIRRYADAAATIKYFREKMRDALDRTVKRQKNWGAFTPALDGLNRRVESLSDYVYVLVPGKMGKGQLDGAIEFGIWWNPPGIEPTVILYARIKAAGAWLSANDLRSTSQKIRPIEIDGSGYLFSSADADLKIETDFAALLGEIVKNTPAGI